MGKGGNAAGQHDNALIKDAVGANVKKTSIQSSGQQKQKTIERKWYNKGGIQGVSEIGMGVSVALTPILFVTSLAPSEEEWSFAGYNFTQVFLAVLCFNVVTAFFVHGMRTLFCLACVPTYMTSLLIFSTLRTPVVPTAIVIWLTVLWRVGVCMSVCLHRYSAHAAFKCGPVVQLCVNLLGCSANQGGPIWWASQHRCHHKYCDVPRDPHSALMVGTERAFSFFLERVSVEEEFAPKHNDNWYLRIVDTWCFTVVWVELFIAYQLFGREGLFITYTSLWLCQTITLWFNVANHPANAPGTCKASSFRAAPEEWYPVFQLLHLLYQPITGTILGENNHDDHHKHSMLAKRGEHDIAYYVSVFPLKMLGLVWDVKETRIE